MKTTQWICWPLTLMALLGYTARSQSSRTGLYTVLVTPQASLTPIGVDALAAGGASVAEKGLSTAAFTNPANMHFSGLTVYAEFGKYVTSVWGMDFDYNGQFVAPTALTLGMPLDGISLGVSYLRQYSNHMSSAPISITTPAFPDGTDEFMTYERSVEMHSLCGSASLALNDMISLGLTLGGNYFQHNEELGNFSVKGTDRALFAIAGISVFPDKDITLAASVRYNWSMKYTPELNPSMSRLLPDTTTGYYDVVPSEEAAVEVQFPPICEMGLSWQALPVLKIQASAEFQNWTTALPDAENRWQIHVGGVVDVVEALALRFGFFTRSDPRANDVFDQQFLTAGVQLHWEGLVFSFAMMDSHLFKKTVPPAQAWIFAEPFYQTYFASGVSFTF